jgi:hypothetical protein
MPSAGIALSIKLTVRLCRSLSECVRTARETLTLIATRQHDETKIGTVRHAMMVTLTLPLRRHCRCGLHRAGVGNKP